LSERKVKLEGTGGEGLHLGFLGRVDVGAVEVQPRNTGARGAEMKTAIHKVQRAVKEMRARHEDHAWADSDKA
jgi:hypothetical protein